MGKAEIESKFNELIKAIESEYSNELVQINIYIDKLVKDDFYDQVWADSAKLFRVDPKLKNAKTRKREVIQARQLTWKICNDVNSNASYTQIGGNVGKKDRSTVSTGIKRISGLIDIYPDYRNKYNKLMEKYGKV